MVMKEWENWDLSKGLGPKDAREVVEDLIEQKKLVGEYRTRVLELEVERDALEVQLRAATAAHVVIVNSNAELERINTSLDKLGLDMVNKRDDAVKLIDELVHHTPFVPAARGLAITLTFEQIERHKKFLKGIGK